MQTSVMKPLEQELLLDITSAIASVRDKEDLFHVIVEKIKPVFNPSGYAAIVTINETQTSFRIFLSIMPGLNSLERKELLDDIFPVDPPSKQMLDSDGPMILDIRPLWEKYPEVMGVQVTKKLGIKEIMACPLWVSGKKIGCFHLHSPASNHFKKDRFSLFRSVSGIIAVAVSNILANEEVQLKEKEKTELLSISRHIATVRDKNDLFHLVAEKVRSFIPFDDAAVALVDEKQENFRVFLSDVAGTTNLHAEYRQAITQVYPIPKGSPAHTVLRSDKPVILDLKKELFKNPELDYIKFAYDFGMRQEIVTKLICSNKVSGLFALLSKSADTYSDEHISVMSSISSLIAIAVQNVVANEEIDKLTKQLEQENIYLNEEIKRNLNFCEIIGASEPLQQVFKKVAQVANTDSTVLITGETGTGKELIARAIHDHSARKARPLIKVNCAALPAQLIESELFGHEKGSFTGATDRRIGKFELANGSTIFLDEIGELPLELQAKLLRAIQEKEIERLGGDKTIKIDVRIIAATNRELEKEVAASRFRSDLYYRLNVYPIGLPPLRERREDIPFLVKYFIQKHAKRLGKKIAGVSDEIMKELVYNKWPGNIRELEHMIERSMLLTNEKIITSLHLSKTIASPDSHTNVEEFTPKSLADNERDLIIKTLKYTNGRIRGEGGAAKLLNILPTTLEARMKKLGIKKEFVKE